MNGAGKEILSEMTGVSEEILSNMKGFSKEFRSRDGLVRNTHTAVTIKACAFINARVFINGCVM